MKMFKFGFSEDNCDIEIDSTKLNSQLNWFPAVAISLSKEHISHDFDKDNCTKIYTINDMNVKLIRSADVGQKLRNDKHKNIIKAEMQHSDLLPAIYEGGLKIWECTYDLGIYLLTKKIPLDNLKVLDLGCGAGILGIISLLRGSIVHFQDYNQEVIELFTIPNVLLNFDNRKIIQEKVEFYAGDWASFTEILLKKYPNESEKYDLILTSETIYNLDNYEKLYQIFKKCLKKNGVGYIAGKTYYFGVGGGMRQFEKIINDDHTFEVENVWKSNKGLQREIIKLTHY